MNWKISEKTVEYGNVIGKVGQTCGTTYWFVADIAGRLHRINGGSLYKSYNGDSDHMLELAKRECEQAIRALGDQKQCLTK